jgi:hypothetical protein
MKEMKTYIIALKFVCLTGIMSLPLKGYSQDSHFSQIYEIPILLNPARTGFFKDNYRLAGIYRSQWKEITQPFKTISGTIDLNIPAGKNRTNLVGIGLMNFADKAGDADYTSNYLEAAFSFHKNFGDNFSHYLGMGMMTGFATTSLFGCRWGSHIFLGAFRFFEQQYNSGSYSLSFCNYHFYSCRNRYEWMLQF